MEKEKDDFDTPINAVVFVPHRRLAHTLGLRQSLSPLATQSKDFLSLYSEYLSQRGRSEATITSYLSNLKLFGKWFKETYEIQRIDNALARSRD